jgi:hypothetical protein
MEPGFRCFRTRMGKKLAFVSDSFKKLLAAIKPVDREFRSQRMCPVLRVDYVTAQDLLPAVWQVGQTSVTLFGK